MPENNDGKINVVIRIREKILLEERINAVTSYNDQGVFDILYGHENFISLIRQSVIIHRAGINDQEIKIDNGIMRVHQNNVYFYLNL